MDKIEAVVEMVRAAGYTVKVVNLNNTSLCGVSSYFEVEGPYSFISVRISDHSTGVYRATQEFCLSSNRTVEELVASVVAEMEYHEPRGKALFEKHEAERAERRRVDAELKAAAAARKSEKAARRAAL